MRHLTILPAILMLSACASDAQLAEARYRAGDFPYETHRSAGMLAGPGPDHAAADRERVVGRRIIGIIDDDRGLPDGDVY